MGRDTQELLALKFPNSCHLLEEFEQVCSTVKSEVSKGNKARVCFDVPDIDLSGKIVVKCFETVLKVFRHK